MWAQFSCSCLQIAHAVCFTTFHAFKWLLSHQLNPRPRLCMFKFTSTVTMATKELEEELLLSVCLSKAAGLTETIAKTDKQTNATKSFIARRFVRSTLHWCSFMLAYLTWIKTHEQNMITWPTALGHTVTRQHKDGDMWSHSSEVMLISLTRGNENMPQACRRLNKSKIRVGRRQSSSSVARQHTSMTESWHHHDIITCWFMCVCVCVCVCVSSPSEWPQTLVC